MFWSRKMNIRDNYFNFVDGKLIFKSSIARFLFHYYFIFKLNLSQILHISKEHMLIIDLEEGIKANNNYN